MNNITFGLGDQKRGFIVTFGYGALRSAFKRFAEILRAVASFHRVIEEETKWRT